MPHTRLIAHFGDDPAATDDAERALETIEARFSYSGTVETDTLGARIEMDFADEGGAREAAHKLEAHLSIATDQVDPTTGDYLDESAEAASPRQPSTFRPPITAPPGAQTDYAAPREAMRRPTTLAEAEESAALIANDPDRPHTAARSLLPLSADEADLIASLRAGTDSITWAALQRLGYSR